MDSEARIGQFPQRMLRRVSSRSWTALVLILFSSFYFADVLLRASEKLFWYDELLTIYFARFRNPHVLWAALKTGVESNPPTFHLLTRLAQTPFGEGLIATRLPEILSFWICLLCLFHFVRRRAGTLAGLLAMTIPLLSGAYFYAYEARPLGIVMSFAGVALVCWDHATSATSDRKSRRWWLAALSGVFLFAFAMHCYAALILVPFGVAELLRVFRTRRFAWDIWVAMGLPLLPAAALYVPLIRAFSSYTKNSDFLSVFPTVWAMVPRFYLFLLQGSPLIFSILVALLAINAALLRREDQAEMPKRLSLYDLVVCVGFILLPVLGVATARVLNTTSFHRYFLSAVLGFAVLMAIGLSSSHRKLGGRLAAGNRWQPSWVARIAVLAIAVSLLSDFTRMVRHRHGGKLEETQVSPFIDQSLIDETRLEGQPIAVLDARDLLFLGHYHPELLRQLYPVDWTSKGMNYYGPKVLRPWIPLAYNGSLTEAEFAQQHPLGYVYGSIYQLDELHRFTKYTVVTSLRSDGIHFLAHSAPFPHAPAL